jgi:ABC-type antimicrobial peptide transport system permease subunit
VQSVIDKLNPGFPFNFHFTEDTFTGKFADENRLGKLSAIFAALSVMISCLGLFGLASYMAERRTKEIGIRKIVGASIYSLWRMLSRDFLVLVIIACVVSIPASYLLMQKWLTGFTYRTDIPVWILVVTGASALAITLITVSYQTIRAAKMNPVTSLRSE